MNAAARFADVIEDEESREALARLLAERAPDALERALGTRGKADATPRGRVVTVLGSRGGVGSTTVAVNLAWVLAHEAGRKVALLDLDLRLGTVALSLDLEPTHGLREVLESPDRIDSLFVSSAMARASETLSVLSAEEPLGDHLRIDPAALDALTADLRTNFDWIVIDAPRTAAVAEDRIIAHADKVLVVSDLSLAGMRDAVRLAGWVKSTANRAELTVVVNKVGMHAKAEVPRADFERGIETKVAQILPFDPKTAGAASNAGRPVVMTAKGSALAKGLRQLCAGFAAGDKPVRAKSSLGLFKRK
jgi:pilus assembly protein CpaE